MNIFDQHLVDGGAVEITAKDGSRLAKTEDKEFAKFIADANAPVYLRFYGRGTEFDFGYGPVLIRGAPICAQVYRGESA